MADEYSLRHWHVQDGLPNEEITQTVQDERGYLWVGTAGGLVRFDGTRFQTFGTEHAPPASVATVHLSDAKLGLVVGLKSGGVKIREAGTLSDAPFTESVGQRVVIALFSERVGTVWIGCADGTIIRAGDNGIETFDAPRGLPGARQIGFAKDGSGRIWVCSDLTLLRFTDGKLVPHLQDFGGQELRIGSSRRAGPWLITEDTLYGWNGVSFERVVPLAQLLGAHYVQSLIEDRHGDLWFATRSQGLHRFRAGQQMQLLPGLGDEVMNLMEDQEGNLWVSTNGAGLARVRPKSYRLINKSSGLLVDFSTAVCEDERGAMWFANRDGGVVQWRGGVISRPGPLPDWPTYSAVSVFPRQGGGVGFTCGGGVYHVGNEPDARIRKHDAVPAPPIVRLSATASDGSVWLALPPNELGELRGDKLTRFTERDGLTGREITALGRGPDGMMLCGTANGVLMQRTKEGFARVPLGEPGKVGAIQSIWTDAEGVLWVGTDLSGLFARFEGRDGQVDISRGLPHESVTQIVSDDHGYMWFGSPVGVYRVSRQALLESFRDRQARVQPIMIGPEAGSGQFAGVAQYQPGVWKSADGQLWFATRRGVLQVDPAAELALPSVPRVAVEQVVVDGVKFHAGEAVRFPSGAGKVEVHFSTLCLSTPERLRVKYQLDGYDVDWHDARDGRVASYSRLPPGEYHFRISAQLADGPVQESRDKVGVTVVARWWETFWFRGALLAALVAIAAQSARVLSNRRLRSRLERVERERVLEHERARIARDIHDDVGASLSRISLLTQAARRDADPSRDRQLGLIFETVSQITRSMDEIVWALDPKHDDLDGLANYLASYAQNFLGLAGIRCRLDLPVRLPEVKLTSRRRHHLFLGLKEALNNVVRHAHATEVLITMEVEGAVFTMTVCDNGDGSGTAAMTAEEARLTHGHGLDNMTARMLEVGGSCRVEHSASDGVSVTFSLPTESKPVQDPVSQA